MKQKKKVQNAVQAAGGRKVVSEACGVSTNAVGQWVQKQVPVKYVAKLCELTGNIFKPHELRPDVFSKQ